MTENPYQPPRQRTDPPKGTPTLVARSVMVWTVGSMLIALGVVLVSSTTVGRHGTGTAWTLFVLGSVSVLAGAWLFERLSLKK